LAGRKGDAVGDRLGKGSEKVWWKERKLMSYKKTMYVRVWGFAKGGKEGKRFLAKQRRQYRGARRQVTEEDKPAEKGVSGKES